MFSQRRCPCCIGTEPEYRQHVSRKSQKTTKVQKARHQYVSEGYSDESEGKPYAYLGEGEIWANGAFMKILQRKYGHGAHHCCSHSPQTSPHRHSPTTRQASPTRLIKVPSPICFVSPLRTASPSKRRSPSASHRRRLKSPIKSSCTYRVSPIKSRSEIQDGDLIIETSDHKYLKVLGPEDLSDGDDFYVLRNRRRGVGPPALRAVRAVLHRHPEKSTWLKGSFLPGLPKSLVGSPATNLRDHASAFAATGNAELKLTPPLQDRPIGVELACSSPY
ncbi:hypothetical protein EGR_07682 [Echinococcus granulosus]|uniref:Uncharacterized protein n=1 Tax=Echinococcus granulosus TaxID=6210 RepID=W6U8Y1_ECHGR|nr:hypothetical protein EGR_07682 [Echinococcus granulosus]EUB57440.1 hypothetical protein EGR_07682 [Echinococcus granulosus]